jgi:hypothetical protein
MPVFKSIFFVDFKGPVLQKRADNRKGEHCAFKPLFLRENNVFFC